MAARPLAPFLLERYFAQHEFVAPRLLCCSDCEPLTLRELLAMAPPPLRAQYDELSLGYTESRGHPALLEAIAALHGDVGALRGASCAPVVLAPQEGVYLAMRALLAPGDRVVCTAPGYQSLSEVASAIGCVVAPWWAAGAGDAETDEPLFGFDVDALDALLGAPGETKLLVVNFPHNPTGWTPTGAQWAAIVAKCARSGCFLFSDEMYRGLELRARGGVALPSAISLYAKAVVLCGVSKALSLPGLRIGWLLSRDAPFLARVCELKDFTTICASAPSEILALVALARRDDIIARNRAMIESNLAALREFCAAHRDALRWREPGAGTVTFVRLTRAVMERRAWRDVDAFCAELRAAHGVLLLPASVYAAPPGAAPPPCFRLGFGRANFRECLAGLDAFLRE